MTDPSQSLRHYIIDQIQKSGPVPLGQYMDLCLGHPEFGYYITRDPFGEDGDFTTAPEVSQMFGEMIGAWVIDLWHKMGAPKSFDLIECGAGRGTLMADALRVIAMDHDCVDALNIKIVETSPLLKAKQKETIQLSRIEWFDELDSINTSESCVIIGNEFLDALPVEHFRFTNGAWTQRHIDQNAEGFEYVWLPVKEVPNDALPRDPVASKIYEISPARDRFIENCMSVLTENTGAALFIDYGHTQYDGGETLQAVKAHEFISLLEQPGQCDITAHVNFKAIKDIAQKKGGAIEDIITQSEFLGSLGIMQRAFALQNVALKKYGMEQGAAKAESIHNDLKRLIDKDQMGELFKAICFHHGYEDLKPAGF